MKNKNMILTELPKWESGANKGKVNKEAMVGMDIELLYKGDIYNKNTKAIQE